jgi:hypothetical protein
VWSGGGGGVGGYNWLLTILFLLFDQSPYILLLFCPKSLHSVDW